MKCSSLAVVQVMDCKTISVTLNQKSQSEDHYGFYNPDSIHLVQTFLHSAEMKWPLLKDQMSACFKLNNAGCSKIKQIK